MPGCNPRTKRYLTMFEKPAESPRLNVVYGPPPRDNISLCSKLNVNKQQEQNKQNHRKQSIQPSRELSVTFRTHGAVYMFPFL